MEKLDQLKLIMQATKVVMDSDVCPESPRRFSEWFRMMMFCHQKGYLFLGFNGNKVDLVAVAYRVPDVDQKTGDVFPEEESGNILYVPIVASISKDKSKLTKLLKFYLKDNPDVSEIAYHYRNSEKLKRFHIRSNHGQAIKTEFSISA